MSHPLHGALQYLRDLTVGQAPHASEDSELLSHFVRYGDQDAFAQLVRRHGAMVFGVCRRLLTDADADDAFQATFLVLARRASAIRKQMSLASWLHGVAVRVSRRALADAARRRRRETQVTVRTPEEGSEAERRDLRLVLDEELDRLPEHYRAPLVLCYLEGKTLAEAALQLGCKDGTVCSRLARGRDLLRSRLERRGLTPLVAISTAALVDEGLFAAVPSTLAASAVGLVTTGSTTAGTSARAQLLAEEMMKAMFLKKVLVATAALLTVIVLAAGAGLLARSRALPEAQAPTTPASAPNQPQPPTREVENKPGLLDGKPNEPINKEALLLRLQQERYNVARTMAAARYQEMIDGKDHLETLLASVQSLYEAELDLTDKPANRLVLMERRVTTLLAIEKIYQSRFDIGRITTAELSQARLKRIEAEIQWQKAKQQ
jgi:RNA polymerase sigma factor (sigma-70 family)